MNPTDTQYMSSRSFIKVDWSKLAGGYDKTFGTKTPTGEIRAPTAGGIYSWFVDFVTANFQRESRFHLAASTLLSNSNLCLVRSWQG